jgi:hypothetical protein
VNPFSTFNWLWRAVSTRSLMFSTLFAFSICGISILGWFRHLLRNWGAPWYAWLFLPFVLVAVLGRKEMDWFPDPVMRKKWSRIIILGAVVLLILLAKLAPKHGN